MKFYGGFVKEDLTLALLMLVGCITGLKAICLFDENALLVLLQIMGNSCNRQYDVRTGEPW